MFFGRKNRKCSEEGKEASLPESDSKNDLSANREKHDEELYNLRSNHIHTACGARSCSRRGRISACGDVLRPISCRRADVYYYFFFIMPKYMVFPRRRYLTSFFFHELKYRRLPAGHEPSPNQKIILNNMKE